VDILIRFLITHIGFERRFFFDRLHVALVIFDAHVFFTGRATFLSAVMQIRPQVSPSENKMTMRTFGKRGTDRFCISYVLFVPVETFLTFKNTIKITSWSP
jgi:hypothetical protein